MIIQAMPYPASVAAVYEYAGNGGVAYTNASSVPSINVTYPSGIEADDILILQASKNVVSSGSAIPTPSGWTEIQQNGRNGFTTLNPHAVFWKRAVGTETGTLNVSLPGGTGSPEQGLGCISRYTGCVTSGSPIGTSGASTGSGTSATSPTLSAGAAGMLVVNVVNTEAANCTPPSGYTERYDGGSAITGSLNEGTNASSGNVDSTTALDASAQWSVISFTLLEAGRTGPEFSVSPTISQPDGFVGVGDTLELEPGTHGGTSETYQWYDDGVAISGATSSTYTLTSSELGGNITAVVTATDVYGDTDATSNSLGPVVTPAFTTQTLTLSGGGDITLSDASDLEISNRTA